MTQKLYVNTDSSGAQEILKRARSNTLTPADLKALSTAPQSCRNYYEAAQWLVESIKKQEKEQRQATTEQGELFPLGGNQAAGQNALFRSDLFRPTARGRRTAITEKELYHQGDSRLLFSGVSLDQADLDVLLGLYRFLAKNSESGNIEKIGIQGKAPSATRIKMTEYSFLIEIGRKTGGSDRRWLHQSLDRLRGGSLRLINKGDIYSGSTVVRWGFEDETNLLFVDLDHALIRLFSTGTTFLNWKARKQLARGFDKWLQGYVATHESPHYQTTRGIMELCGSTMKRDRFFRSEALKPALDELKANGTIKSYSIHGHKIRWDK
jgi:hypothetical protein